MILLQSATFQIDLSAYGVSLKEENGIFSDNIYQNYSLPFTIYADAELLTKLGLPTAENIIEVNAAIKCQLVLFDRYFAATLHIGIMTGHNLECNLSYGENALPVYETNVQDLPWPLEITTNLTAKAKGMKSARWPQVPYNFPMVYYPGIVDGSNYDRFEGFVNNYANGAYKTNEIVQEENDDGVMEDVYVNRNVMVPFPYLLEILRFGFAQEGKRITGDLVDDETFKKAVYIPENYLERYNNAEFTQFSFNYRNAAIYIDGVHANVYSAQVPTASIGDYELSIDLNIPPGLASVFRLLVLREPPGAPATELLRYESKNTRVQIKEELTITVDAATQFEPIGIYLYSTYTDVNISAHNSFEFSFSGGQLNVFPNTYSLSKFVPDMTFGEFVNTLKNWLNLDITIAENYVRFDYVQNTILQKPTRDHRHLETPDVSKKSNNNRFYKLFYANDEKVFYSKNGQVFSDTGMSGGEDVIELEMNVQPAVVESNKNVTTAVAPKNRSDLDFCLYDVSLSPSNPPLCKPETATELSLQKIFIRNWAQWLHFRVNSYTYKEDFKCSSHEELTIAELSHKYNELHILKKLDKKFESEKVMKVKIESETF